MALMSSSTANIPRQTVQLPRALIFLASIWLIASWMLTMGFRTPVHPSSASFTPGVRMMILSVVIGLMIGWPLLRLSQEATRLPIRQTLLDLMVLLSLVQVVLWPLRVVTTWSPERTAAIDLVLGCWLIIVGAIIAASIGTEKIGPRIVAMLTCLGLCLLGPAAVWVGIARKPGSLELVDLSPLLATHTLGGNASARPTATDWQWIWLLAFTAVMVWVALAIAQAIRRRTTVR